ncbi:MAG: hypothetical protein WCO55_03485 [Candidatus Falkowbacteria bacterium]
MKSTLIILAILFATISLAGDKEPNYFKLRLFGEREFSYDAVKNPVGRLYGAIIVSRHKLKLDDAMALCLGKIKDKKVKAFAKCDEYTINGYDYRYVYHLNIDRDNLSPGENYKIHEFKMKEHRYFLIIAKKPIPKDK